MISSSTGALRRPGSESANKRSKAAFWANTHPSESVTTTGCGVPPTHACSDPGRLRLRPGAVVTSTSLEDLSHKARSIRLSSRRCHPPNGRYREVHQPPMLGSDREPTHH